MQQTAGVSRGQVRHLHRPAKSHRTFQSAMALGRTEHRGAGFLSDASNHQLEIFCSLQLPPHLLQSTAQAAKPKALVTSMAAAVFN